MHIPILALVLLVLFAFAAGVALAKLIAQDAKKVEAKAEYYRQKALDAEARLRVALRQRVNAAQQAATKIESTARTDAEKAAEKI